MLMLKKNSQEAEKKEESKEEEKVEGKEKVIEKQTPNTAEKASNVDNILKEQQEKIKGSKKLDKEMQEALKVA
jgi:hypothetical protein